MIITRGMRGMGAAVGGDAATMAIIAAGQAPPSPPVLNCPGDPACTVAFQDYYAGVQAGQSQFDLSSWIQSNQSTVLWIAGGLLVLSFIGGVARR